MGIHLEVIAILTQDNLLKTEALFIHLKII